MPGHGGDARREPVDIVEQVERVRDAHHPDERDERVEDDEPGEVRRRHQVDDDAGDNRLHDQLRGRAEVEDVIERAEPEHQAGRDEQRRQRGRAGSRPSSRSRTRQRDRAPAEERHGLAVPAGAVRSREKPGASREARTIGVSTAESASAPSSVSRVAVTFTGQARVAELPES